MFLSLNNILFNFYVENIYNAVPVKFSKILTKIILSIDNQL